MYTSVETEKGFQIMNSAEAVTKGWASYAFSLDKESQEATENWCQRHLRKRHLVVCGDKITRYLANTSEVDTNLISRDTAKWLIEHQSYLVIFHEEDSNRFLKEFLEPYVAARAVKGTN